MFERCLSNHQKTAPRAMYLITNDHELVKRLLRILLCSHHNKYALAEEKGTGEIGDIRLEGDRDGNEPNAQSINFIVNIYDFAESQREIQRVNSFPPGGIPAEINILGGSAARLIALKKVVCVALLETGNVEPNEAGCPSSWIRHWCNSPNIDKNRLPDMPSPSVVEGLILWVTKVVSINSLARSLAEMLNLTRSSIRCLLRMQSFIQVL